MLSPCTKGINLGRSRYGKTWDAPAMERHGPLLVREDNGTFWVNILAINQKSHRHAHSALVSAKRAPDGPFVNKIIISNTFT